MDRRGHLEKWILASDSGRQEQGFQSCHSPQSHIRPKNNKTRNFRYGFCLIWYRERDLNPQGVTTGGF